MGDYLKVTTTDYREKRHDTKVKHVKMKTAKARVQSNTCITHNVKREE